MDYVYKSIRNGKQLYCLSLSLLFYHGMMSHSFYEFCNSQHARKGLSVDTLHLTRLHFITLNLSPPIAKHLLTRAPWPRNYG